MLFIYLFALERIRNIQYDILHGKRSSRLRCPEIKKEALRTVELMLQGKMDLAQKNVKDLNTKLETSQQELKWLESKGATPMEKHRRTVQEGDPHAQIWDAQINLYRARQCLDSKPLPGSSMN
jgi:hypothetical protein